MAQRHALSASGRHLLVCDLGLDRIFVPALDRQTGKLIAQGEIVRPSGSGPRHLAFSPAASFVYLISQNAGTITTFARDDDLGERKELQTILTVPAEFHGDPAASGIQVHPSGHWLHASNRGHNSLAIFRVDPAATGLLRLVGIEDSLGATPRNFTLTASGDRLLVADQDSDPIVVFRLEPLSGLLTERSC